MQLLWALAIIVVLAITPSVLFLLFWRLLVFLRDDALIEAMELETDFDVTRSLGTGRRNTVDETPPPPSIVTCPSCGTKTVSSERTCILCENDLERTGRSP